MIRGSAKIRLTRAAWFASTALSAAALAGPAFGQTIDPGTTPQGGVVVGGSSTIIQAPGSTTINQSSERTAINWQSFNVGSNAQVQFNQPNAQAIALNRVTGGDLSVINGRIDANGQIVLVNQSGVVFAKGSQVNAENIVVSTSDITPKNFMAGNMVFDGAPNPGAKIVNEGNLTAKQAGLVGLVAPQVNNSGVITASLGHVVLAGASAFTLDLYGDRLISLDVTQAVRAVDIGGQMLPALVTNSGIIVANGGHITLTAQDADALVTQLINAGGTLQADSAGGQMGEISLAGVGGNIAIAGNLLARGVASDAVGGRIEAISTGTVAVAATADIDASGPVGGGLVAIGTDLARAQAGAADQAAPKAAAVQVAAGAVINAAATSKGNGGKVVLLSKQETDFQGSVSVQGGAAGGNGGAAEISSDGVISLGGTVLATAINGQAGEILLDPDILYIANQAPGTFDTGHGTTTFGNFNGGGPNSVVQPVQLDALSGRVTLEAASLISVVSAVDMSLASALSLISLGDISITAAIRVSGSLEIDASNSLVIDAPLNARDILLNGGTSGTSIDAPVTAGTLIALAAVGTITEDSFVTGGTIPTTLTGALTAPTLISDGTIGGDVALDNANDVGTLGGFTLAGGGFGLVNSAALTITGPVVASNFGVQAPSLAIVGLIDTDNSVDLNVTGDVSETGGTIITPRLSGDFGGVALLTGSNTVTGISSLFGSDLFVLDDTGTLTTGRGVDGVDMTLSAGSIDIGGIVSANELALESTGAISEGIDTGLQVGTLDTGGTTIGGNVDLNGDQNEVSIVAGFTMAAGTTLNLLDNQLLTISGPLVAPVATLQADAISIPGSIDATVLVLNSDSSVEGAGAITAATLTTGGGDIGGDVSLTGVGNSITTLSDFAVGGNIDLHDGTGLTVTGTVAAPNGEIDLSGTTLGEAAGGSVQAGTLGTGTGSFSGGATLGHSNSFGVLNGFTAASLLLADSQFLSIDGVLNVPGSAVLNDSGPGFGILEQEGGTVIAGTLGGMISGNLSLSNLSTIGLIDGLTLGTMGLLLLNDASTLQVGNVTAYDATIGAAGLILSGTVDIADELDVATAGSIVQTGGVLDTGFLNGENSAIGGDVLLTSANSVAAVADFFTDGRFDLNDAIPLDIVRDLSGADVTIAAPAITLNGEIVAGSTSSPGTLALAGDSIVIGPEMINGDTFNSAIYVPFGTIEIAPYTDGRAIDIGGGDAGALDIQNSLIASFDTFREAVEIVIGTADGRQASTETIDNSISFGSPLLDLNPSGTITDNGVLTADTLAFSGGGFNQAPGGELRVSELQGDGGAITGPVLLGNTINQISELGSLSVTGADLVLATGDELFVGGQVSADDVLLESLFGLELGAGITAATGGTIDLVSDTIESFSDATLQAVDGRVALAPYDVIAVDFGGFDFSALDLSTAFGTLVNAEVLQIGSAAGHDGGLLTVTGPVTIAAPTLALDGGGITFIGSLVEPGLVTFASAGDVAESNGGEETPAGVIAAGTVGGNGGTIALTGANRIGELGTLISGTDLAVDNAIPLDVAGLLRAPGLVSLVDSGGSIAESTGVIDAGTLTATTTTGDVLLGNGNSVNVIGTLQSAGQVTFNDALGVVIAGSIVAPGEVALSDAGGIGETGRIVAGTLTSFGPAIGGDVVLNGANTIATLGGFAVAAGDDFSLNDSRALNVTGPLTAGDATLAAAGITLSGSLGIAGELALEGGGGIDETTGVISAATLDSGGTEIGGDVTLNNGNHIGTLGGFDAAGGLALNDLTPLIIGGNVSLGGALALLDPGAITQTAGSIQAAGLNSDGGSIGGAVSLLDGGNVIPVLGAFTAPGGLALADTGPLDLAGDIFTGTNHLDLFVANGAIIQSAGVVTAATLDASGDDITLADQNAIGRLGTVTTGDLLVHGVSGLAGPLVADNATVTAPGNFAVDGPARVANALFIGSGANINQAANSGPVTAGSATFDAAGAISLAGDTDIGGLLDLIATGNVVHATGVLNAGTLTGSAGQLASFTGPTDVGTLGSFLMQDSLFVLDNDAPLTITGPVKASAMSISAVGVMTLAGSNNGGLFFTGGIAPKDTLKPRPQDSALTVTAAPGGGRPQLIQTGVFYINAGPNAATYLAGKTAPATIFITTTPNGSVTFANAPPNNIGLVAPPVDVVITTGPGGTVTGNVNLKQVVIVSAGKVNLTGTLNQVGGQAGAGNGVVSPYPDPNFQFNSCPIGSVNCTILPVESLPAPDPLQGFDVQPEKKRKLNHNVQLPGIATRDF